jgi:hypothetical protein
VATVDQQFAGHSVRNMRWEVVPLNGKACFDNDWQQRTYDVRHFNGSPLEYFARPALPQAQPTDFPYGVGDSIQIEYADGATRSCVIEHFFGAFVSCRASDRPFGPKSRPFVYNLSTTVSVSLAGRAGESR